MKKEPNKKLIGLFLVIGFAVFLGIIGKTVLNKISSDTKDLAVMYFDESLPGLSEGAPVIFQGVEVGKVVRIVLVTNKDDLNFHVAVYARFKETDIISEGSLWEKLWNKNEDLDFLGVMIREGLRARLASQSYLTGQLRVDLVMLPDTEVVMFDSPKNENIPQIPTVLSQKEELVRGLNRIKIQETLEKINTVADTLGRELPVLLPAITKSAENLDKTLENVAKSTEGVAKSTEDTMSNLNETLHNVSDAAKSIENLTDYLERHPESLIKGKKGE